MGGKFYWEVAILSSKSDTYIGFIQTFANNYQTINPHPGSFLGNYSLVMQDGTLYQNGISQGKIFSTSFKNGDILGFAVDETQASSTNRVKVTLNGQPATLGISAPNTSMIRPFMGCTSTLTSFKLLTNPADQHYTPEGYEAIGGMSNDMNLLAILNCINISKTQVSFTDPTQTYTGCRSNLPIVDSPSYWEFGTDVVNTHATWGFRSKFSSATSSWATVANNETSFSRDGSGRSGGVVISWNGLTSKVGQPVTLGVALKGTKIWIRDDQGWQNGDPELDQGGLTIANPVDTFFAIEEGQPTNTSTWTLNAGKSSWILGEPPAGFKSLNDAMLYWYAGE